MRAIVIFIAISIAGTGAMAQQLVDTLTIAEAYRMAWRNAPLRENFDLNASASDVRTETITTSNLPHLSAYGKAWYQSDAVSVPSFAPGMEGLSIDRFQYNAGVEVTQKIFDGGTTNKQLAVEEASLRASNAELRTKLYPTYHQVNEYFFTAIVLQESREILELKSQTLKERAKIVSSGVKNGVVLPSELEKLEAELVAVEQHQIEIDHSIEVLKDNLKILTGIDIEKNIILQKPFSSPANGAGNRPEYELFQRQKEALEQQKVLKESQLMPKLSAYGQAGYSYPGLNFFENQSDPYYIIGGKLSWTLFDWNRTRKEKEILSIRQQSIDVQRSEFERNLVIALNAKEQEIAKLEELIQKDELIIEKRQKITKASSSALDNGTITAASFIDDVNAEVKAKLDQKKHETQLLQAKAELAIIKGIDHE